MPTDFLDNNIHVGDWIIYAWRRGSQLGLRRAQVNKIIPICSPVPVENAFRLVCQQGDRTVIIQRLDNVIVRYVH